MIMECIELNYVKIWKKWEAAKQRFLYLNWVKHSFSVWAPLKFQKCVASWKYTSSKFTKSLPISGCGTYPVTIRYSWFSVNKNRSYIIFKYICRPTWIDFQVIYLKSFRYCIYNNHLKNILGQGYWYLSL